MYVLDESHHPQVVQTGDARCQIDLIQLIGFLKFRSSTLNSDQASFKQVVFASAERTTINIFAERYVWDQDEEKPFQGLSGFKYLIPGLSRFALQPWAGVSERLRRKGELKVVVWSRRLWPESRKGD